VDAIRSAWGSISEISLEVLSGKVKPSETLDTTLYQGPVEIRRKERDTSKDTKFMDIFNSPNIVAERRALFKPFYNMAKDSIFRQERMRADFSRTADKIFGTPGLFGRRGGLVTKAQRETFFDILIEGDALEHVFSDAELTERGAAADTIKAYRMIRGMFDRMHRMINAQRNKYGKDEMAYRTGYVPHFFHSWRVMRDGEILSSYRSLREAVKAAENMEGTGLVIEPFQDDFGGQMQLDAVILGDMSYFKLINNVKNVFALTKEEAAAFVSGDIAKMQNRSRIFKNAKQRRGVKGWDHDMEYALRHYANYAARYIAMDTLKHDGINLFERTFGRWRSEHKGLGNYTKQYLSAVLGNPVKIDETLNNWVRNSWIGQHVKDYIGDRPFEMLANSIAGLTAISKLGLLNFSSALMNYTQFVGTTAVLGYGPVAAAMAEYARPNAHTKALYRATGVEDSITMENPSGYSKAHQTRKALSGMQLFRYADGMVRKVTVIAAYRKALSEGKNKAAAIEYAKKVNDDVNFDYSVADTPYFMTQSGALGKLAFQFKKYGIKELELISKLKTPGQKIRFWVPMLLLSGVFGLPGGELLKKILEKIFAGDDEDLELELKKSVAELPLPGTVRKAILYGALSNAGIDIGKRVGMGDFIPSEMRDFTGPAASTIANAWQALPKIWNDGNFIDTIEAVSPGIANVLKGLYLGETRDKRRGRLRFEYATSWEKAFKTMGFRPIRESIESDAVRLANYEQRQKSGSETDAIDDFIRVSGKPGTPAYKASVQRLVELGITKKRLESEMEKRRMGGEAKRKMWENRNNPEILRLMQNYQSM
jgi:hypothetical protein